MTFKSNKFRVIASVFWILLVVTTASCRREDPNPELMDPIYTDLQKRVHDYEQKVASEEKKLQDLVMETEKLPPGSIDLAVTRRDVRNSQSDLVKYQQLLQYLKIRTERRKYEGRLAYKQAFKENKPWPDPNEFKYYKINQELVEASKNWELRVPQLYKTSPNYKPEEKKPEKSAEGAKE